MTKPESLVDAGENAGNASHEINKERGQRVFTFEEYGDKLKYIKALEAHLAKIRAEKGAAAASGANQASAPTPEPAPTPAPEPAPEEPEKPEASDEPESAEKSGKTEGAPSAAEVGKKVKKNHALKNVLIAATAIAFAGIIGFGIAGGFSKTAPIDPASDSAPIEMEDEATAEKHESISEISTYKGQFASEDGKTFNKNKNSDVSFGEPLRSGLTEDEMKEDFGGRMSQPAQLAATYYDMQKKTSNPNFGVEGAKFDSPNELTEAMKNDPELHQKVYDFIMLTIGRDKLSEGTVNGPFNNLFMTSDFETGDVDTSKVEIVGCTTKENDTKVYKLEDTWGDGGGGGVHTDVFTFKEICGGQPLDEEDFTTTVRQIIEEKEEKKEEEEEQEEEEEKKEEEEEQEEKEEKKEEEQEEKEGVIPGLPFQVFIPKPKNEENLVRIDEEIKDNIEEDIHTDELEITPTENITRVEEITEKPAAEEYKGAEPVIIQNEASKEAEPIGRDLNNNNNAPSPISEVNDYSQDLGGANQQNTPENPVVVDQTGQVQADEARIPDTELLGTEDIGGTELNTILADLGIE